MRERRAGRKDHQAALGQFALLLRLPLGRVRHSLMGWQAHKEVDHSIHCTRRAPASGANATLDSALSWVTAQRGAFLPRSSAATPWHLALWARQRAPTLRKRKAAKLTRMSNHRASVTHGTAMDTATTTAMGTARDMASTTRLSCML
jgi:hypothetical protein